MVSPSLPNWTALPRHMCYFFHISSTASTSSDPAVFEVRSSFVTMKSHLWASWPSDAVSLNHTLVRDGAGRGFEQEFTSLGPMIKSAATRNDRRHAGLDDVQNGCTCTTKEIRERWVQVQKPSMDQFILVTTLKTKRYRARQKWQFDGPTEREDAEDSKGSRWIQVVADILRGTLAPMGKLLSGQPAETQQLGGGRRASTLRSRLRALRSFLRWLALHHELVCQAAAAQLMD